MYDSCITSKISLRTRGPFLFSFNDCSHCSTNRHPFAHPLCAPPRTCSCYANSVYRVPISPSYCYSLYGLRQSSLIQRSSCRKLISGGFDRCYYSRIPVCDADRSYYCDKVRHFREINVGGRRGRLRKCMVFEEMDERYDLKGVDEAEIVLSLLTGDIGEEGCHVRKETKRLCKKPLVDRGDNGEVSNKCAWNKKRVDLGALESEARSEHELLVSSSRKDDNRKEERIQKEQGRDSLLRKEKLKAQIQEEKREALLRNERATREKEAGKALLRKASHKAEEKQERESLSRKEDWKARAREEERDELLRREEHRQRVRKDGSSCSSYYSFSSTGDYESDNEIELREERTVGDSSSGYVRNSRNNETVYEEAKEEDQRHEDYEEDHRVSVKTKNTAQGSHAGSRVVESDLRKKSEKKLDVSIEETEHRKQTLQMGSKVSMVHESGYGKSSDSYMKYDGRKAQLTGSTRFDKERKQQHMHTGEEFSGQSETRLKYKQLVESPDSKRNDFKNPHGLEKKFSGKDAMTAKVTSSSWVAEGANQIAVGLGNREDEYHRNSLNVAEASQEIDIRKTSISHGRLETSVKTEEDYSTKILGSTQITEKQQLYDQHSRLVDSRGNSQQLTKKESTSILKRQSDNKLIKQEDNMNLAFGSSSGPKEQHSSTHAKIIEREDSRSGSDNLINILITHSGDSGGIVIEKQNKINSKPLTRPPSSHLGAGSVLTVDSTGLVVSDKVSDESSQSDPIASHWHHLERSPALHNESYGGVNSHGGQPQKVTSQEDAIGSAAHLEKSSARHVGEFVNQVKHEILSSEIQREKKTYETKFVHEEKHDQKSLVQYTSGDSQSKKQDSRHTNQDSGTKGPSSEMWKEDEPSVQEPSKVELQEDASKAGNAIAKRTGRSLWNVIADIVQLRWSSRSGSHSISGVTGGRSSPNQSTSSETWFSGHEAEENEEERRRMTQEPVSGIQRLEENPPSKFEEGSSSASLEGHLEHVGMNAPSSSVDLGTATMVISLPSTEETSKRIFRGTSSMDAMVESSNPLPSLRLRRSPPVGDVSEAGESNASDSGRSEQLNTGSVEQSEPVVIVGELKGRQLRRNDQVIKDRFDVWEEAYRLEAEQRKNDEMFMREALSEAQKAADNWEVPVGAVLVHNGKIIARGCNLVEELRDSTAHAEMICIREASNALQTWRLSETTLYVTLEPCAMCAGAILQARIDTVVWGAPNKLLGADGSWIRLFPNGDGGNGLDQGDKPAAPIHPFHPKIIVRRGVLASECADAMQQFFQLRRKKKEKQPDAPSPPSCLHIRHHHPSKFLTKMHDVFNIMFCL